MGHSIGDGVIVVALAGALVAYWYFKHLDRQRRLEISHQERMAAMEKGIPLPELLLDPPKTKKPTDPRELVIHGIAWLALGGGAMVALRLISPQADAPVLWPLPLPLAFLGAGFLLYAVLASDRER